MQIYVGIDPGYKDGTAVAVVDQNKTRLYAELCPGEPYKQSYAGLSRYLDKVTQRSEATVECLIERPRIYQQSKARNIDIEYLIVCAGAWASVMHDRFNADVSLKTPHQIKRQLTKPAIRRLVENAVTTHEKEWLQYHLNMYSQGLRHNLWDAVSMALIAAERIAI